MICSMKTKILAKWANSMKNDYHQLDQDSPPSTTGKDYYRVVEDGGNASFTAEECYKVVGDTPTEGFTAEEYYKITEGPEKADSLEDLDKPPEVEPTQDHEKIKEAVKKYFSESFPNSGFESKYEAPIDIGGKNGQADLELYVPEKDKRVVIAEAKKGKKDANYGRHQLFAYLSTTNTRFGIFANSLNRDNWIFYENLRHFRFRRIERSQFEEKVANGNYDMPDKPLKPEDCTADINSVIETMRSARKRQGSKVEDVVKDYFSPLLQHSCGPCRELEPEQRSVWINTDIKFEDVDFLLQGQDGSYIAIVEFRDHEPFKQSILDPLLCATDTRFGIRATSKKWYFYERQGSRRPGEIEADEFAAKMIAQAREAACPVFKGDKISKEDWDGYSKTWKTLKSEKVWRVTETYHPKCSLKIDKYISDDEYKWAQEAYPGCSIEREQIITKAELDEQHKTWPKLTTEKGWHVTGVFHSGCSFRVGQYISQVNYQQARKDYPGCSVKKGDILTKVELTEHRKTWNNLKAEKIWCITDTDYQQAQQRIRDEYDRYQSVIKLWQSTWSIAALECKQAQDERDRSRSKIKFWQLVTAGVGIFFLCFGVLFLMQRRATEDAVRQIATLVNQRTQKETEIRRKDWKIQSLTTSVQTVNSKNETLSEKISELENQERNRTFPIDESVVRLRKQLNEEKNENQKLQSQLNKKDAEIWQLQNDITTARNENRRLQNQTGVSNSGIINQNDTVQRLENEKAKVFNENRRLQNQNHDIVRQNRRLRSENEALQKQLDNTKQNSSNQAKKLPSDSEGDPQPTIQPQMENLMPEAPKKIQEDRTVRPVDISRNNQGCFAFEGGDYDKAINQFEQAIKADSQFAVAHYNLGCAYLETKTYKKAVDAFDETVVLDQNFKEAYYNLGIAWFRMNIFQSAKQAVEKALSIDPNYQLAQELLTEIENAQQ